MDNGQMTDQCFDEPDSGREPIIPKTTNVLESVYNPSTETWSMPPDASAIRNTAAKLELAKKALTDICDLNKTLHIWEAHAIAREALKQLEG